MVEKIIIYSITHEFNSYIYTNFYEALVKAPNYHWIGSYFMEFLATLSLNNNSWIHVLSAKPHNIAGDIGVMTNQLLYSKTKLKEVTKHVNV